jgi:diguanylate cyclase (GGDEF)-like protein
VAANAALLPDPDFGGRDPERLEALVESYRRLAAIFHDGVALLMLDIDDFKRVNDVCGHGEGDQVLKLLAELLSGLVRASDTVCRVGGEEFAVILPRVGRATRSGWPRG